MMWARALSLAALLVVPAGFAGAQSPWPDSPTQPSAPPASSPWPSSPGAPQAAPQGGSPWPSSPASATPQAAAPGGPPGGAASPWNRGPQRDCGSEFMPLRAEAEKRAGMIKAAAAKKSQPEMCDAFKNFAAAEAKMVKYVADNSATCGIPPEAAKNMKANHAKTIGIRDKVCSPNAAAAGAPRAPSLSDALGTSSRLPDTSAPAQQKGSTFNTLTGNAIAR